MRTSLSRVVTLAAVVGLSAACMTGCQTSSGFKSPSSSNWFSWGKKKPANSSFAATKPDTNLPAPPSGSMTPNAAPSYAQSPATRPASGANTWSTTHPNTPAQAANPVSYGSRPDSSSAYSNATYSRAPGYGAGQGAAAPLAGGAPAGGGAAQGFYGSTYRDSRGPAPGESAYGGGAGAYGPINNAAPPPGGGGRGYSDPYGGAPGSGGHSAGTPAPAWNTGEPGAASGPAPRASSYDAGGQYTPAVGGYGQPPRTASSERSPLAAGDTYGGARPEPAPVGNANSYLPTTSSAPGTYSGGSYRPGSTSRPTQFGTSDNISLGASDPVRRASFGTDGEAPAGTAASGDNSPPAGGAYGGSPARTATGGSPYSYPSSYDR